MTLQAMNLDIIGTIYDVDNTDPENPISTPVAGFHVNTDQPITGADEYLVTPTTPRRVFAGGNAGVVTIFYAFPDEDTFKSFFPGLYSPKNEEHPPEPEVLPDEIQA